MPSEAVMSLLVWSAWEKRMNGFKCLQEEDLYSSLLMMASGQEFASNLLSPALVQHQENSFSILTY